MSILIQSMSMPKNCAECPCEHYECMLLDKDAEDIMQYFSGNERHPECPLIELPAQHGRLVDADELKKFPIRRDHYDKEHGDERFINGIETVMEFIDYAPTIIEAEGKQ